MTETQLPLLRNRCTYRVRYADVDRMDYMYYAHYLRLFEIGRTELLRQAGVPYTELEAQGILLPVLEARVFYRNSAHYDDVLTIESTCQPRLSATLQVDYRILRDGKLIAEGYTVHTFVSRETRRVIRPPRWLFERLSKVTTCGE